MSRVVICGQGNAFQYTPPGHTLNESSSESAADAAQTPPPGRTRQAVGQDVRRANPHRLAARRGPLADLWQRHGPSFFCRPGACDTDRLRFLSVAGQSVDPGLWLSDAADSRESRTIRVSVGVAPLVRLPRDWRNHRHALAALHRSSIGRSPAGDTDSVRLLSVEGPSARAKSVERNLVRVAGTDIRFSARVPVAA
jgi:hypothetical protein